MSDRWVRALAEGGAVRVVVIEATRAALETGERHGLDAGARHLGAEVALAALMLGAHIKGEERILLQLQAGRPRASAMAEVDAEGNLRARVSPTAVLRPERLSGVLLATKSDAHRELYRGLTAVEHAGVAEALEAHLRESSQVDSHLAVIVDVDDPEMAMVAGIVVERMPTDRERPSMEPDAFHEKYGGLDAGAVLEALTGTLCGEPLDVLSAGPVRWSCRCGQDKVDATLAALGPAELRAMREEDGGAEIVCHFCNAVYRVSAARLAELEGAAR